LRLEQRVLEFSAAAAPVSRCHPLDALAAEGIGENAG
jgi:hypothetical protein